MDKYLNESAQRCCKMFTEILQKHPDHKQGVLHTLRMIEKAPKVAFQIAEEMQKKFKDDAKGFSAQMVMLAQGIGLTNAALRLRLLSGDVTPSAFAGYQKVDLQNTKQKQAEEDLQDKIKSSKRSDAMLEFQKKNTAEGMHQCKKCKRRRVSQHLQQTRSADEPMTEFYTCLDCGHQWKI